MENGYHPTFWYQISDTKSLNLILVLCTPYGVFQPFYMEIRSTYPLDSRALTRDNSIFLKLGSRSFQLDGTTYKYEGEYTRMLGYSHVLY